MAANYVLHLLQAQHTEELEYCRLLREAVRRRMPVSTLRNYALDFWNQRLKQDFLEEELKLIPILKTYESACSYHNLLKLDHELVNRIIEHIESDGSSSRVYSLLAELIEQHVIFQEDVIFPKITLPNELPLAV